MHPLLIAVVVMGATWSAWSWYFERVWAAPEEAAALALTAAILGAIGVARVGLRASPCPATLMPVAILLAVFAASHAFLPPLVRAAIAIAATLFCLHVAAFRERPPLAFWGLVALALPVLPSLQFVLGYPMRVVSAALTVALLQAHGLAVTRQGTFLVWHDEMIQFDAPCSGVNMLWAGLLLTLMGCVLFRFGPVKLMIAVALTVALAVAGNVLRAASLFYVEAGLIVGAPAWGHDGIGIAAFMVSAAISVWLLGRLRDRETIS
ncbi:MAG TPA: archaeosortase/exosortase family protein [Xanthobacteraceae bacterium]